MLRKTESVFYIVLLLAAGCSSFQLGSSVTPSVTGRVLAADTHEPLAGVKILRVVPGQAVNTGAPAYGAQALSQGRPEITGADGSFIVPGRSYVTLFRRPAFWSVRLAFQAANYVLLQTNFTTAGITNLSSGDAPVIYAGDVLLQPLGK